MNRRAGTTDAYCAGGAVTRTKAALAAGLLAAAFAACGPGGPTPADAEAFVAEAETRLLALRQDAARAAWLRATSPEGAATETAASAAAALRAAAGELARGAVGYDGLDLPPATARKLTLLKTAAPVVAPAHPPLAAELDDVLTALERTYRLGAYCADAGEDCRDRGALEETVSELRDTDSLLDLWREGRAAAAVMRSAYARLVEIANAGAVELGYADAGERWRSAVGRPAAALPAELDRLWGQVRPLYESLHCHVRAALGERYGTALAPPGEAIPAHLLGDLGDGRWSSVHGLAAPRTRGRGYDATRALERSGAGPLDLVGHGERFFVSLGFEPLPASFRERSLFARPADRGVLCGARAWNLDGGDDVRLSACLDVTGAGFAAVHRDLFRVHRRWASRALDPLFRTGPEADFLETAGGEAVALSVTPAYLAALDLAERPPGGDWDVPFLLRKALDEIAALPFALLVDRWRWLVFAGEVRPDGYNRAWWDLRRTYQGVRAPAPRSEEDFDPGSTRRVAAATPAAGDFLAGIARFQIHRALCAAAGGGGPPHRCSVFGSPEAGARLRALTATGGSRPWPDALEAVTGARRLDASALLEYFAPLAAWLDEQNAGRSCGW